VHFLNLRPGVRASPAPPVISLIFYDVCILNSLGLLPALHIPSFSLNESIALT
jgi:hypothetical protein